MLFQQLELGPMQNFSYLIGCDRTKECAVIDCGFEHERLIKEAEQNGHRITKIFLTHFHYDHSREAEELARKTGAQIYGHERGKLKQTGGNWIVPSDFLPLQNDADISIGTITGKAIFTPGHQGDHFSYIFHDSHFFSGDCLFIGGVGRTDLPDSDPEQMKASLELVKTLPDHWIVYPGHNYGEVPFRNLGEEKQKNMYLMTNEK